MPQGDPSASVLGQSQLSQIPVDGSAIWQAGRS